MDSFGLSGGSGEGQKQALKKQITQEAALNNAQQLIEVILL